MKFALKRSTSQQHTRARPTRNSSGLRTFSYSNGITNTTRAESTQPRRLTKRASNKLRSIGTSTPGASPHVFSKVTSFISILLLLVSLYFVLSLHRNATVLIARSAPQGLRLTEDQLIYRSRAQYEAIVQSAINSTLANKYKLTFNEQEIADTIMRQLPEVKDVSVAISLFSQRPRVGLVLSEIAFRATDNEGRNYVVTDNGVVLPTSARMSDASIKTPLITTAYSLKEQEQKAYFTASEIAFMRYVAQELSTTEVEQGSAVLESFLLPPELGEIDVRLQQKSFIVKMSYFEDPKIQLGALKSVLQELGRGGAQPEAYIDVRLAEKVFIK